jgi:hypothetical protein
LKHGVQRNTRAQFGTECPAPADKPTVKAVRWN